MEILRGDIEVWLTTKLEYQWSSENISSLLTKEILQGSYEIFSLLESSIKIKYLFSFLTLRKQSFQELKDSIYPIIDLAKNDSDQWVSVVAEQIYPILLGIENNFTSFQNKELISPIFEFKIPELQKLVEEIQTQTFSYYQKQQQAKIDLFSQQNDFNDGNNNNNASNNTSHSEIKEKEGFYPMEFAYINKRLYPPIPKKNYHFSIKENKNDVIDWENITISEYLSSQSATSSSSLTSSTLSASTPSLASVPPSLSSPPRISNIESKKNNIGVGGSGGMGLSTSSSSVSSPFGRPSLLSSSQNRSSLFRSYDQFNSPNNNSGSPSSSSSDRQRLTDRKKRMRMIEIDELPQTKPDQDKKRKKTQNEEDGEGVGGGGGGVGGSMGGSMGGMGGGIREGMGGMSGMGMGGSLFESDKNRRKRERAEEAQRKKEERELKKRKKQEEVELRKLQKEEKRVEKEAMREARKLEKEKLNEQRKFTPSKVGSSPLPSSPKKTVNVTQQFNSSSLFPSSILSSIGSLNAPSLQSALNHDHGLLQDSLLNPSSNQISNQSNLLSNQTLHPYTPSFSPFPYVHSSNLINPNNYLNNSSNSLNNSNNSLNNNSNNNNNNLNNQSNNLNNSNNNLNNLASLGSLGLSKPIPSNLLNLNLNLSNINFNNNTLNNLQRNPNPINPLNPSPLSNPNPYHNLTNPPPPPIQSQSQQHSFESLFPEANRITLDQRKIITNFLDGKQTANYPLENSTVQILLNEKQVTSDDGRLWLEQILFEMNYDNGSWRKLRRRKAILFDNNNNNGGSINIIFYDGNMKNDNI